MSPDRPSALPVPQIINGGRENSFPAPFTIRRQDLNGFVSYFFKN